METIEIRINLDPVKDGPVFKETKVKRKDAGALVIATNGEYKIVDAEAARKIMKDLSEAGESEYMGKTDYLIIYNGEKAFYIDGCKYFAGSALIMKYDGKRISLLTREEMEEAESVFASRLVILTGNGQDFSAYEI